MLHPGIHDHINTELELCREQNHCVMSLATVVWSPEMFTTHKEREVQIDVRSRYIALGKCIFAQSSLIQ